MNEDLLIDDLLANLEKKEKKKVNSKDKGQRGERDLCDVFSKRFGSGFFRVVGSGNRVSQVTMTEQAKQMFTGDLVSPEGFKFSIECKYGYCDIDLATCFDNGIKEIDKFLEQAERDAEKVKKQPMLCWRKPRQHWLAFIKEDLTFRDNTLAYSLCYREWICVSLSELMKLPDSYFFI